MCTPFKTKTCLCFYRQNYRRARDLTQQNEVVPLCDLRCYDPCQSQVSSFTNISHCAVTDEASRRVVRSDESERRVGAEVSRRRKCHLTVGPQIIEVEVFVSHLLQITKNRTKLRERKEFRGDVGSYFTWNVKVSELEGQRNIKQTHKPHFYFFQSSQRSENCVSARLIMIIMTFRHCQPFLLPAIVWTECDVRGPIERMRWWHGARTNHGCPH